MKGVIRKIHFGLLNEADIRAMSALEITSSKMDEEGSISDPRLGALSTQSLGKTKTAEVCPTCKLNESHCPGHFAFITLQYPVIHPLFVRHVLKLVRMFCFNCARFLYPPIQGAYPHFEHVSIDKTICAYCCAPQPIWTFVDEATRIKCSFDTDLYMKPAELRIHLMNLNKEDLRQISFTTEPENFVITLLPVGPPCVRPPLYIDGQLHDDHLSIQYNEIVKMNSHLGDAPAVADLKKFTYKIANIFIEKRNGATTVGSAPKPIIKRLSGKKGHMRDSIMGKRVDKSGRTVIGPEPTLMIHQVGIPEEMAYVLTVKELVSIHTLPAWEARIRNPEDVYFIYRQEGSQVRSFNTAYIKEDFKLQVGDQLDRRLQDNDIVIINRQPTLHGGSLIAFNAVIQPGRTIRFNLSNTKTFNADFDGDEMNLHVPQWYDARAELQELSSIQNHLLSQKNGKPNIVLVQDNLLALYLMTHENMLLSREELFDLTLFLVDEQRQPWELDRILRALARLEPFFLDSDQRWQSRVVISLCLPDNFDYADEELTIQKGAFIRGIFNKRIMNHLLDIFYHIYPASMSECIVNNLQIVGNHWLRLRGFSIGLEDCMVRSTGMKDAIQAHVQKSFYEAALMEQSTGNARIREVKIQEVLNRAQAVGLRITKEGFAPTNNFIHMIQSGSKGDYFNVAQICGLLGQQYIKGGRIRPDLNNGTRTLYQVPFQLSPEEQFEARGFIRGNFFDGLSPREVFFHGEAGRMGVVDTAMGTSEVGYMHRRIIKLVEDVRVTYDGTVRDDMNTILQFRYGNGLDVLKTPDPSYIHHLAAMLNNDYETLL